MGARDQAALNTASGGSYPQTPPGEGGSCPLRATVIMGVFFDGTGNNMYRDKGKKSQTNVVRLHDCYKTRRSSATIQVKQYIMGIGAGKVRGATTSSPGSTSLRDMAYGRGWKERLNIAYRWVEQQIKQVSAEDEKILDLFGFSRGAALARTFANLVVQGMVLGKGTETIVPNLRVRFVGIFDTVGSFDTPGDNVNPGQSMHITGLGIGDIQHFTARHEHRQNFPLTLCGKNREYPGVHSDVGGGYGPKDQGRTNHLALIPFRDMWLAGRRMHLDMANWTTQSELNHKQLEALRAKAKKYAPTGDIMFEPGGQFDRERQAFFEKYIHESMGGDWFGYGPHRRDESGRRRKFQPKKRALTMKPEDFTWAGEA